MIIVYGYQFIDTLHNNIQHNETEHKGPINDTQHKRHYAIMLIVAMLSVVFYLLFKVGTYEGADIEGREVERERAGPLSPTPGY